MRQLVHRGLLWLWKVVPFPGWTRRLFLGLIARRFLIGALAVVEDEGGRVLFLKQTYRAHHEWGLPGGWIKSAETVQQGLAREVLEETGLEVEVGPVLGVLPGPFGEVVIGFMCSVTGGRLTPSHLEISDAAFFAEEHLPPTDSLYHAILALRRQATAPGASSGSADGD